MDLQTIRRPATLAIAGVTLLLFAVPLFIKHPYGLHILILTLMSAYLSLSWSILGGMAGQLNMGHSAFVGIGAYTSTILFTAYGISPWLGMVAGGLLAALAALVMGYPSFRLRGAFYSLVTLAFAEALRIWVQGTQQLGKIEIRGAAGLLIPFKGEGFWNMQFGSKAGYYYVILSMLVLLLVVALLLHRSRLGLFLAAVRDNEAAAEAGGVNTTSSKLTAAALSAFFAATAGTFYAQFHSFIDAHSVLGGVVSLEVILMATVGGVRSVWGPILGAFLLTPLSEVTRVYAAGKVVGLHTVIYGLALVMVILYMPDGIMGWISRFWRGRSARTAMKGGAARDLT